MIAAAIGTFLGAGIDDFGPAWMNRQRADRRRFGQSPGERLPVLTALTHAVEPSVDDPSRRRFPAHAHIDIGLVRCVNCHEFPRRRGRATPVGLSLGAAPSRRMVA